MKLLIKLLEAQDWVNWKSDNLLGWIKMKKKFVSLSEKLKMS